jgi:hypothetical protein
MFEFFFAGSYDDRKVDRYEDEAKGLIVSTCSMNDTEHPFETAVSHPRYNNGEWVIVQEYDTQEDAQKGHDEWVARMTAKVLPNQLEDVSTSGSAKWLAEFDGPAVFERAKDE